MGLLDFGLGASSFKSTLNSDDIEAIKAYFDHTSATSPEAQDIKNQFNSFYQNLGTFEAYSDDAHAKAAKFRNDFNVANARTQEEKVAVQKVISTGMTREQAYGLDPHQKSLYDRAKQVATWAGIGIVGAGIGFIGWRAYSFLKLSKLLG